MSKTKLIFKLFFAFLIIWGGFFCLSEIAQAAITLDSIPDHFIGDGTENSGTPGTVGASLITENPNSYYYLKVYFYPPSNTRTRFGYIWNENTNRWIDTYENNSEQPQIQTDNNGNWTGNIQVKTDIERNGYIGPGDYILKIKATLIDNSNIYRELTYNISIIEPELGEPTDTDTDDDGISNDEDNCPNVANPDQADTDSNGIGDACETVEETNPPQEQDDATYQPGSSDVVINEFVSDPSDDEVEWIEFYNKTSNDIDLTDWTIEDGTAQLKGLTGLIIPKNDFLVLEKGKNFSFSLNNSGDILKLKYKDLVIDQVAYGDFDDGNIDDNAPTASDPNAVARNQYGADTDNNSTDFFITNTLTKGKSNLITNPNSEIAGDFSHDIIINEILPNPAGADTENEFIELKNKGSQPIDLRGWKLKDNSQRIYIIKAEDFLSTLIQPGKFFVLYRKQTGIALNNSGGDAVYLLWPNSEILESVIYQDNTEENQSYSRQENDWFWTLTPTPDAENIIEIPNQNPVAVINAPTTALVGQEILFDASDSFDPDADPITQVWTFENGLTDDRMVGRYTFNEPGEFEIKLVVTDDRGGSDEAELTISVYETLTTENSTQSLLDDNIFFDSNLANNIILTEFLPNPIGSDDQEWIELYNPTSQAINLKNWSLDDQADGGSRAYTIAADKIIQPGQYLIIPRAETKLALNNEGDSVRLLNPNNEVVDWINYPKSEEGYSYNLAADGSWYWSGTPTPAAENIIDIIETGQLSNASSNNKTTNKILDIPLSEVKAQELNEIIRTQGVVAVEPGILGEQIFYISGSGIQIYCYKKDFPELQPGDLIEITGTLSQSMGEKRLKIKSKEDIVILNHQNPPEPQEIKIDEINDDLVGDLVVVNGEVVQVQGNSFYLDDGSDEIKVYIKTTAKISKLKLTEGLRIGVTGILSRTTAGYRLLPRYESDINFEPNLLAGDISMIIESAPEQQRENIIQYLTAAVIVLIGLCVVLLIKNKKR